MRRTILLNFLFVLLTAFAAHQACAQRNGASGQGQHGQGFAGGSRGFSGGGHGFSGGNHGFSGNRGDHDFDHDRDRGRHDFHHNGARSPSGWGYPYGYGYGYLPPYDDGYMGDDFGNNDSYQSPPPQYDQQPSQPAEPVQPPPPPVAEKPSHPVVKEYKWPAASQTASSAPASEPEPQNFAIVLKNGSTLSATMVLASANSLHYVDTEGKLQHIDIAEVDRAATLKLDRARNLNIYLPAAQ